MKNKVIVIICSIIVLGFLGCSQYNVYENEASNKAELNNLVFNAHETNSNDLLRTDFVQITTYAQQKYQLKNCEINGELIGFDEDFYYLCYKRDSDWEYVRYNRKNEVNPEIIFKTDHCFTVLYSIMYDKKLYIVEAFEETGNYKINLVEVDTKGNKNTLFTQNVDVFPQICQVDANIIMRYTNSDKDSGKEEVSCIAINMNSHESTEIGATFGMINSEKFYHINEDLISEKSLPGTEEIKNINGIYRINNQIIIVNNSENIYVYNLNNQKFFPIEYSKFENINAICQAPIFYENEIGYLVNNKDTMEVLFYEITLETYY